LSGIFPVSHRILRSDWFGGVAVAILSASIMVALAMRLPLHYDEAWDVFIARQDSWRALLHEVLKEQHPPLFYVLEHYAISLFGYSPLAYRALSIVAFGVATVFLARTAARLTDNAWLATCAAAAFGLSSPLAYLLRGRVYAVFLALLLTAVFVYVEWLQAPRRLSLWMRLLFAGALSAALLTHYSSLFFLGASIVTPILLSLMHPRWRVKLSRDSVEHPFALAMMFGIPLIVGAICLRYARSSSSGVRHLSEFLYDSGVESLPMFLLRTTKSLSLLFMPNAVPDGWVFGVAVSGFAAALVWLTLQPSARRHLCVAPVVLFVVMLAANIVGGVTRRYPYGGKLRHEIFLFPFGLLSLFAGVAAARRAVPKHWRAVCSGVTMLAIAVSAWLWMSTFHVDTEAHVWAQTERFRAYFPAPPAVSVDHFNFVVLFGQLHDWQWRLRSEARDRGMWQVWDVSKNRQGLVVCRHAQWQLDFSSPDFYADIRECLEKGDIDNVAVYRAQQMGIAPKWNVGETASLARQLSADAGVTVERVIVEGDNVYASFRR